MNSLLVIVAYLAALNPARTRLGLPEEGPSVDWGRTLAGVILGVAALIGVSAGAGFVLDRLEISPETFRIAAGFVLVIAAAWMLFVAVPRQEPVARGWAGAVWPVAYPRVVSPETLTVALTVGASEGVESLAPLVAGAALLVLGLVPNTPLRGRVLAATGRVIAAVLVVVGIWLAIQGVREV